MPHDGDARQFERCPVPARDPAKPGDAGAHHSTGETVSWLHWIIVIAVVSAIGLFGHHAIAFMRAVFAIAIVSLLYNLATMLAAVIVRAKVEEFIQFYGMPLVRFGSSGLVVRVGWIPVGGSVKIWGIHESTSYENEFMSRPALRPFNKLHPLQRAFVAVSGPAFVLLVASLALGSNEAHRLMREAKSLFENVQVASLLHIGTDIARRWLLLFESPHAFAYATAITGTWFGLTNIIPLPGIAGGDCAGGNADVSLPAKPRDAGVPSRVDRHHPFFRGGAFRLHLPFEHSRGARLTSNAAFVHGACTL